MEEGHHHLTPDPDCSLCKARDEATGKKNSGLAQNSEFIGRNDASSSTKKLLSTIRAASTPPERPKQKQRHNSDPESQFFEDAFSCRTPNQHGKGRGARDTAIIVDIKSNGGVCFPHGFMGDFAFFISEIYQRPAAYVTITNSNAVSILFDSSSAPAYQISITALNGEVATTKNKRAAGMIQEYMCENFSIPASRGILLFHSIAEDNLIMGAVQSHDEEAIASSCSSQEPGRDKQEGTSGEKYRKSSAASMVATPKIKARTPSLATTVPDMEYVRTSATIEADRTKPKTKKKRSLMALLGF